MEWEEAVIWVLVMLPSVIPRGSSHDPSTEKKQTNKQKLKQNKNENPKKPKVNIFLLKEGRVEGERRKSRKFWLENQMVRIIPFRKL